MMVQSNYVEFPIGTKKIQLLGFLRLNREKGEACPAIFWDWLRDTQNNRSLSDSSGFDAGLAACGSMVFDRAMVGSLFCTGQCRSNSLAEMLGRRRFRPTARHGGIYSEIPCWPVHRPCCAAIHAMLYNFSLRVGLHKEER